MPDTKPSVDAWSAWQQAGTMPDSLSEIPGASRGDATWTVNAHGQHLDVTEPS